MKDKGNNILESVICKILRIFKLNLNEKYQFLLIQILSFLIVGTIATVIDIGLLYILKEIFNVSLIISNTISFSISVLFNYFASVKWVFKVNKKYDKKRNFILFVFFSLIGLLLNDLFLWLGVKIFNIYYILSKAFATLVVMIFNFITRKKFLEK